MDLFLAAAVHAMALSGPSYALQQGSPTQIVIEIPGTNIRIVIEIPEIPESPGNCPATGEPLPPPPQPPPAPPQIQPPNNGGTPPSNNGIRRVNRRTS